MFFIGIFGIEARERVIRDVQKVYCRECNKDVSGRIIKRYNFFHFFFIPLLKWNERYYVKYDNCSHIYGISKEKGKRIESDENVDLGYWDLKDIEEYTSSTVDNRCFCCSRVVEREYLYCPYCGEKLYK